MQVTTASLDLGIAILFLVFALDRILVHHLILHEQPVFAQRIEHDDQQHASEERQHQHQQQVAPDCEQVRGLSEQLGKQQLPLGDPDNPQGQGKTAQVQQRFDRVLDGAHAEQFFEAIDRVQRSQVELQGFAGQGKTALQQCRQCAGQHTDQQQRQQCLEPDQHQHGRVRLQVHVKVTGNDAPIDFHDLHQRAVEHHVGDAAEGQAGDHQILGLERLPFA
ncbi:hypothetical protein D3C73_467630 [compost metagenome]